VGNMCAKIKCPRYARFDELNQRLTGQKGLQEAAARVCRWDRNNPRWADWDENFCARAITESRRGFTVAAGYWPPSLAKP
jgi:hypothetical protein